MNHFTPELYELIDERGNRSNFELLDTAILDGTQYYVMIPAIEDEGYLGSDGEIIIMKSEYIDGEEMLASILDENEFEIVSNFFMERLNEIFENVDDEYECNCGSEVCETECNCKNISY